MTIGRKLCHSRISLDALDHGSHTVGALRCEMFFEAEFFELAQRIIADDFLGGEWSKHHEDHCNEAFDDEGITIALQVKLLAVRAFKHS